MHEQREPLFHQAASSAPPAPILLLMMKHLGRNHTSEVVGGLALQGLRACDGQENNFSLPSPQETT